MMLLVTASALEKKALHLEIPVVVMIGSSEAWGHHLPVFPIRLNVHLNECMACISLYLFYSSV